MEREREREAMFLYISSFSYVSGFRGSDDGGTEGGMSNGAPLVPGGDQANFNLMSPLQSVDLRSKRPADASVERSDVCAAPAAAVVGESVVTFEIARAFLEKFGVIHCARFGVITKTLWSKSRTTRQGRAKKI